MDFNLAISSWGKPINLEKDTLPEGKKGDFRVVVFNEYELPSHDGIFIAYDDKWYVYTLKDEDLLDDDIDPDVLKKIRIREDRVFKWLNDNQAK